jgi:hypothetical protein
VHLTAVDDIDPGRLLVQERGLRGTRLGVSHVFHAHRSCLDLLLQYLVPARKAMSAYHGGRVLFESHLFVFSLRLSFCFWSARSDITVPMMKQQRAYTFATG